MQIHEYQAKKLFQQAQIQTPKSVLITRADEARSACAALSGDAWMVKAQIHAGGRGKSGGVVLCSSVNEVQAACDKLLGAKLISAQTDKHGLLVQKILIEARQNISTELYLGLLIDRESEKITILASECGGMDIEKVAAETPNKIIKYALDPLADLSEKTCIDIAKKLNIDSDLIQQFAQILMGLYTLFCQKDANLIEINPLIISKDKGLLALDGKIEFDDNALFRHKDIAALQDFSQLNEKSIIANTHKLSYVSLEGNIGCMVNGAGLAMATMDLIAHYGEAAANFLDVGGNADSEGVAKAFELIQTEANVRGILVNIFGGIVRCDLIAEGILHSINKVGQNLPLVVRLAGTNAKQGLAILAKSEFNIHTEPDLNLAVSTIIRITK